MTDTSGWADPDPPSVAQTPQPSSDGWAEPDLPDAPWAVPAPTEQASGFFASIPHGILRGLSDTASAGAQAEAHAMSQPEMAQTIPGGKQTAEILEQNITGALPKGNPYAEKVGEFLGNPASYLGPQGLAVKAGSAVLSGLGSAAGGQLLSGTQGEPYGELIGAIIGGSLPRTAAKIATPLSIAPERQAFIDTLRKEGIEPTAGQVTGHKALQYTESALGNAPGAGGAASQAETNIAEQFTRAALARVGESADRATPDVVNKAFTRIGNQFDSLARRNNAVIDTPYLDAVTNAKNDYFGATSPIMRKPIVEKLFNDALTSAGSGTPIMRGEQYKVLRSQIERVRRNSGSDPETAMALADIRSAMDDLMERSIGSTNPSDLGAWREVRNQYRNMLVLEKATTAAGESSAEGLISPAKIRQGVVSQNRRAYARGIGDYADLARAGEAILRPLPTSGTMERSFVHTIPATLAGATAATYGGAHFALPAAMAGMAAPGMVGRGIMSAPVQNYLKNQAFADALNRLPSKTSAALKSSIPVIMQSLAHGGSVSDEKLTHDAVHYVDKSTMPGKRCETCTMFIHLSKGGPGCTLVKAPIKAAGYCNRFKRR